MNNVRFYNKCPKNASIKYAVIVARHNGKWIMCRHKERETWEIPGGHLEIGETPDEAAARELWEETGSVKAEITPICVYGIQDYGMLFFAEVEVLSQIPSISEIREIELFDQLPTFLTYPHIQPALFDKVQTWLRDQ